MNVNGVSLNQSGLQYDQGAETVTVAGLTRIHPRDDNQVDLGSASKRFKTIFYSNLLLVGLDYWERRRLSMVQRKYLTK